MPGYPAFRVPAPLLVLLASVVQNARKVHEQARLRIVARSVIDTRQDPLRQQSLLAIGCFAARGLPLVHAADIELDLAGAVVGNADQTRASDKGAPHEPQGRPSWRSRA